MRQARRNEFFGPTRQRTVARAFSAPKAVTCASARVFAGLPTGHVPALQQGIYQHLAKGSSACVGSHERRGPSIGEFSAYSLNASRADLARLGERCRRLQRPAVVTKGWQRQSDKACHAKYQLLPALVRGCEVQGHPRNSTKRIWRPLVGHTHRVAASSLDYCPRLLPLAMGTCGKSLVL
jgi:hypothetical protein